ncbi:MAG: hypothetical protein JKX85_06635 [Phycisphaeraceae bacterium]|nr:hypothetical protein [Phycisphaeraceae bacterium]
MTTDKTPSIYCPACGVEHEWVAYLRGQEFQCACGRIQKMPSEPPAPLPTIPSDQTTESYSLASLVEPEVSVSNSIENVSSDASDELEVIEEDDTDTALDAGDDVSYELAADDSPQMQLPLPVGNSPLEDEASFSPLPVSDSPSPDASSTPKAGMYVCKYCHKQYPSREMSCPYCGCDELGRKIEKGKKKKDAEPVLRILGIPCTPVSLGIVAILILIIGSTGFWVFTGPAAKFRLYGISVVNSQVLMLMDIQPRGNLVEKFSQASGSTLTMAGSATLNDDNGYLVAGKRYEMYTLISDPTGQFICLDVAIQQGLLESHKSGSGYDMMLVSSYYSLISGSTTVQGTILMERLPNQVTLGLGSAMTSDVRNLTPAGVLPDQCSEGDFVTGLPFRGSVTFKGTQGMTGSYDYYAYARNPKPRNVKGLAVTGKLQYQSPYGIDAAYAFNERDMTLNVSDNAQVWRGVVDEKVKASWSPWHQFRFTLIFPRPPKGKYDLMFNDQRVKRISVP